MAFHFLQDEGNFFGVTVANGCVIAAYNNLGGFDSRETLSRAGGGVAGEDRGILRAKRLDGGIAIVIALIRSLDAADRTNDIVRAALLLVALGLVAYETLAVVPAMTALTDLHSSAFDDLHRQSSQVYSGVVLLAFAALVLAAVRGDA